jgi:crossover junction endodeoxyribonuclease RuvC
LSFGFVPTKDKVIILGIDPGLADTGFGVIKNQNGELNCLAYGTIKTSAKLELGERLRTIHLKLADLIKKYRPSLISVEELFFCNNVKTALVVGQARGVIMLTAQLNKVKTVEFTPFQIKQAVATYGHAGKEQVQKMVGLILNLKELPKPDDAADALAIAICAANLHTAHNTQHIT